MPFEKGNPSITTRLIDENELPQILANCNLAPDNPMTPLLTAFASIITQQQTLLKCCNKRSATICQQDVLPTPYKSDVLPTLAALLSDVDKQVDTARAVRLQHSRARLTRNVIKEQHVTNILDAANFDTDEGLIDAVHLLGLVMQGFVDGLRVPNEDEEENETSEEE
ncbi:hypothetical protein DdX_08147 [Ditylenchus destructor]|uniref:Uncharacterized protein n=1 Tax=Ditylenchus destructor TaxID=166010 RepID=A0AAD4R470_9BILA|nr:hypothetical protein DdX_08147 [Ditylenchus destructor]